MSENSVKYTKRFLARVVIEAATPLAVGSGEKDITTDSLVALDVNGLPYIPGTAVAGVVRNMLNQKGVDTNDLFGFQNQKKGSNDKDASSTGHGSEIIFSEAKILDSKGDVVDGLDVMRVKKDSLLNNYAELPIRQHVKINACGVNEKGGKFDEQVVFTGTRFCFEVEMLAEENSTIDKLNDVLNCLYDETFRLGGGTRSGFGKIKIIETRTKTLDLKKSDELKAYLSKSSSLCMSEFWNAVNPSTNGVVENADWTKYVVSLQPEDFFLFGSGFGDDEADITPVKESRVVWKDGKGCLSNDLVLIPATSVKGALSHRVAYYWNKHNNYYAGSPDAKTGNENLAVRALFGYEDNENKKQQRGNVIFSDVVIDENVSDKILNHVSIDRFTGGAIDGALFTERVSYGKGNCSLKLDILVKKDVLKDANIKKSFESALGDLCNGMLPLGGGVNRGNGVFLGSWTIKE